MTREIKQQIRRSRRGRLKRVLGGAAALAAPLFGASTAHAELIEYTAEIDITSTLNLTNTIVGDTVFFSGTVETDNLVDGGSGVWEVPFESFEYHVDGSATEIFEGTGVTFQFNPSSGELDLQWQWESPYSTSGEFTPNAGGLSIDGTGPDVFSGFHPSGLPVEFDFSKVWHTSFRQKYFMPGYCSPSFEFYGNVLAFAGPETGDPPPPACDGIVGDANCDGFVGIGEDILPAFTNFTGPGSFGLTRADGDVEGTETGTTTDLEVHDGDVDISDILTMFAHFTGPPSDEGSLAPANTGDPTIPDLVYDPATGEVVLDVDGSGIIGYSLKSGGSFLSGGHTPILGGVTTSLATELAEAALSSPAGQNSVGFVFPVGLNLAGLNALLTTNEVSRGLGAPIVPFDLVVLGPAVPEPSTAALAATAGLAGLLALRKRRGSSTDIREG